MSSDMLALRMAAYYAQARALTVKTRTTGKRFERGASALEWAIISAIVVAIALGIAVVVKKVVSDNNKVIGTGSTAGQ